MINIQQKEITIKATAIPILQIGIGKSGNDTVDHAWKTLPGGKQILIRKGDPGALNGNDMRKIDAAVDSIVSAGDYEDMGAANAATRARNKFIKSFMPEDKRDSKEARRMLSATSDWAGTSVGLGGTSMSINNNVMKGRDKHVGLSAGQINTMNGMNKEYKAWPSGDMLKAQNAMIMFNRGAAKKKFGDKEFTVYRGIHGDQATAILAKAKRGDTIRISSNSLSSFTSSPVVAKNFSEILGDSYPGLIIRTKITYKNVFDSWASDASLSGPKGFNEKEIIVSPRGMKITGEIV